MSSYEIFNDRLIAAFQKLQRRETAPGEWGLGGTALPRGEELQKQFPIVGRFFDGQGQVASSQLSPNDVAKALEDIFV
jgi:hypothetical protein